MDSELISEIMPDVISRLAEGMPVEDAVESVFQTLPDIDDTETLREVIIKILEEEIEAEETDEEGKIILILHGQRELPLAYQHVVDDGTGKNVWIRSFLPSEMDCQSDGYHEALEKYYNHLMDTEVSKKYPGGYLGTTGEITDEILKTIGITEYDASKAVYSTLLSNYPEIRADVARSDVPDMHSHVRKYNNRCYSEEAGLVIHYSDAMDAYFTMPILEEILVEMWTQDVYDKYGISRESLVNEVMEYRYAIPRVIPVNG